MLRCRYLYYFLYALEVLMAENSSNSSAHLHRSPKPFLVGLGASAGGIKALKEFFSRVPADSGAAYAVILHLSPDHDSRLAEVLQVTASIPVTQVTRQVAIEPNHVYVVPPNKSLEIADGTLTVEEMTRPEQRRAPVDVFFRALADSYGSRSVCVVLSGTGPNGSAGLKRIKEYGGLAIAQDPKEAEYSDMPRNAIATGLVDFVLPVAEIPPQIAAYHARLWRDEEEPAEGAITVSDAEALRDILKILRVRTGHDFSNYKPATLQRRVERRMHLRNVSDLTGYLRLMREQPDEAVLLMKELLISVTNFFRDPLAYQIVAERVIPRIFANKGIGAQVRVWVAGCATGEEAYSIAILLAEHTATLLDQSATIQVFATDLDENAIATARDGFYTDAEVADLSEERLRRFFVRETTGYRVRRDLREMLLFAHHNLIRDPPFSHLDLISCRNLLIYLNRSVQDRVIETFHFALRPGGFLFLGGSETADGTNDLFVAFDKNAHVYENRTVTSRVILPQPDLGLTLPRPPARAPDTQVAERISPADLHQRLLEQYAAPSVVVTEEHNVVHISQSAGQYLQVTGGEPSRDLLKMVRNELRPDLRAALHQAISQRTSVRVDNISIFTERGNCQVSLEVRPVFRDEEPTRGYLLVVFHEEPRETQAETPFVQLPGASDPIAGQLEEELARLKVQLRTTIEQAEEAKASNEELQAMNEELRSAAEELETSKEELQSVNEELTTVNQELKIKIEELALTNNDFQNLINSSDIGTIFLDRDLRVKLSTPAAGEIFNLLRSDVGRPLSDITSQLLYEGLHEDAQKVLKQLQTLSREVQTGDGRWHLMRISPYRTTDDRIDGVVITFLDIGDRIEAETRARRGEERLRLLIGSATDYSIFTMTEDGVIDSWNAGAERHFGYAADEVVGQTFNVLFTPEDRASGVPEAELHRAQTEGHAVDERFHVRKDGSRFYFSGETTKLGQGTGLGFAKIARDLTEQRRAAEALMKAQLEVEERVRARTGELQAEVKQHASARQHIAALLARIVTAQEDERARIARDLHDQLGQQLTALRLSLERYRERLDHRTSPVDDLDRAVALAQKIDEDLDFLAWELRPAVLDDLGLAAALPRFVREWSAHYGIAAEYSSQGFRAGELNKDAEVAFYRIAQEALNNISKHAHASRVDVILETRDSSVVLMVEDDGIGFEPSAAETRESGIGLIGMRERAGLIGADLQIESAPGEGTSIFLRAALSGSAASEGS
jgi:two-component system, chemotaxis family, CheB/CheR fusion protein